MSDLARRMLLKRVRVSLILFYAIEIKASFGHHRVGAAFSERHCRRYGKQIEGFDAGAERALMGHSWPGNVRELSHAVERGV